MHSDRSDTESAEDTASAKENAEVTGEAKVTEETEVTVKRKVNAPISARVSSFFSAVKKSVVVRSRSGKGKELTESEIKVGDRFPGLLEADFFFERRKV